MSGIRVTDQQVRLYMTNRKHHSQKIAAAKSGMSKRTARRVEQNAELPSQQPRAYWRSRPDPFADVWESEVVPLLRSVPKLKAITLLRKLQEDHPERFPDSMRRTLERHVSQWRALEGPSKEVFFPQTYQPGVRGLSDFTHMAKLTEADGSNADGSSATVARWLRSNRWEHTAHESRHTMADRLREVGCPAEVRKSIGGWAIDSEAAEYGKGYSLPSKNGYAKLYR